MGGVLVPGIQVKVLSEKELFEHNLKKVFPTVAKEKSAKRRRRHSAPDIDLKLMASIPETENGRIGGAAASFGNGLSLGHPGVSRSLSASTEERLTLLPGGGYWFQVGPCVMQIGCPPETIKDSLNLGLEVPRYFIVFGELFSIDLGINCAELEFPCYFNYFIRKKRTIVLTTKDIEKRLRQVFQETLLGPTEDSYDVSKDFCDHVGSDAYPDFFNESLHLDPDRETLEIDSLICFKVFKSFMRKFKNEKGAEIYREVWEVSLDGEITVTIDPHLSTYTIESAKFLGSHPIKVPCEVVRLTGHEESVDVSRFGRLSTLPLFGITMLGTSHGFDPKGQTTGFVVWANRRGTMVDPPSNALATLQELGISTRVIDSIVLTHCHGDHDAGTFRKLLFDQQVELYTTKTIMDSFLRKYAAITGSKKEFLLNLFETRPILIGKPCFIHGAEWNFRYSLHTIPCIGFTVHLGGKTLTYSADTHYSPALFEKMLSKGVIGEARRDTLRDFPWNSNLVLHEAGVPPIHTPIKTLMSLPQKVKATLYVVHVASTSIPPDSRLRVLCTGQTVVVDIKESPVQRATEILDLFSSMVSFGESLNRFLDSSKLMYMVKSCTFPADTVLCEEGTPGDELYIILRGEVQASWKQEGQVYYKNFDVGDYFGETSLVTGEPRNADVIAKTEVEVAILSQKAFYSLTENTDVKEKLLALSMVRKCRSYQLMNMNTVLKRFSSASKTMLESGMRLKVFKKGESLWKRGDLPKFVCLVRTGFFVLRISQTRLLKRNQQIHNEAERLSLILGTKEEELTGTDLLLAGNATEGDKGRRRASASDDNNMERKTSLKYRSLRSQSFKLRSVSDTTEISPISTGNWQANFLKGITISEAGFMGDGEATLSGIELCTDVVCVSEVGTVLAIDRRDWIKFCRKFPGLMLFFQDKQYIK